MKMFMKIFNNKKQIRSTNNRTRRVHGVQLVSIHWLNKEGVLKLKKKVEP